MPDNANPAGNNWRFYDKSMHYILQLNMQAWTAGDGVVARTAHFSIKGKKRNGKATKRTVKTIIFLIPELKYQGTTLWK